MKNSSSLITIGGRAGSGKGTFTCMLSEKLGYQVISIGDMKRSLAKSMGLSITEFNLLGEKPENIAEFDLKYEDHQKSLSLDDKILLDSRLGFFCQPNAIKIFLDVDLLESAKRIFEAGRDTDEYSSIEEVLEINKARDSQDSQRYLDLYGVDHLDVSQYDIVIDTTELSPSQVLDQVLAKLPKHLQ